MSQNSTSPLEPFDLRAVLPKAAGGEDLTAFEAEFAFDVFMEGEASPVQMAALLTALRVKGVTPGEVAGGVRALRKAMIPIHSGSPDELVDTCGTGGGAVTTFNISTAAALVARGAGARIAKHGNRSFTSRSGSADVLEALDVRIELSPEEMARVLEETGLVFMFAPLLHPAMRHLGPVRRELGFQTIMNLLGPLTNPAGVKYQLTGAFSPALLRPMAETLRALGSKAAWLVHGDDGADEVSIAGPTTVVALKDGAITELQVRPEDAGLPTHPFEAILGGTPEENAAKFRALLDGAPGAYRDAVVLNAAAALVVVGRAPELKFGAEMARESIDSGAAKAKIEALAAATSG